MPLLTVRKEVYDWLKDGRKTIDVRKGSGRKGEIAVFQCGASHLRLSIVKRETGKLAEVIKKDNYKQIIPTAERLEDALDYLKMLYGTDDGVFTAYYLTRQNP